MVAIPDRSALSTPVASRMAFVIRLHLCGSLAGRDVLGDCPFFG